MSTNMPTIIKDRTVNDVNRVKELVLKGYANMTAEERTEFNGYMKGRLVASDFNRLCSYSNIIINILNSETMGYNYNLLKTTWQSGEIVKKTDLVDFQTIIDLFTSYEYANQIDLSKLNYLSANQLEQAIENMDTFILCYDIYGNLIKKVEFDLTNYDIDNGDEMVIDTILSNALTTAEKSQTYKIVVYGSIVQARFNMQPSFLTSFGVREIDLSHCYCDYNYMYLSFGKQLNMPIIEEIVMPSNYSYNGSNTIFYNHDYIKKIRFVDRDAKSYVKTAIESNFAYACDKLEYVELAKPITSIGSSAFSLCQILGTIILPDTLTTIGNYAFSYVGANITNVNVIYNGTMAQWNAITKGTGWKDNSKITKIQCTDGTISV